MTIKLVSSVGKSKRENAKLIQLKKERELHADPSVPKIYRGKNF